MSYAKVFRRIWSSPNFMASTEDARMMTLYLLTTEHGTSEGLFKLPVAYAANDLRWTSERASKALAELVRTGFIGHDEALGIVLIRKALEWNKPQSPNNVKGAANAVAELRDTPLRQMFLQQCDLYCPELANVLTSENGWIRAEIEPAEVAPEEAPPEDPPEGASKDLPSPFEGGSHSPSPSPSPSPVGQPLLSSEQARTTCPPSDVEIVFDYWVERLDHPNAKLDDKRRKAIAARLKDGYEVDDLKLAIDGILLDPHKMGQNDRARKFDDIELACRTAANVDALIDLATNGNPAQRQLVNDRRSRTKARGDEWTARMAAADTWMTPAIEVAS